LKLAAVICRTFQVPRPYWERELLVTKNINSVA
jgi:hypothetical protein